MHDEPLLIKACLDNPTDNTVRLAYADWLDENGTTDQHRARSEWIRLTCGKTRKSTVNRQPGERDWMAQNAHRLWPTLVSAITGRLTGNDASWVNFHTLQLATGTISLLIPIPMPTMVNRDRIGHTRLVIYARRGITTSVHTSFRFAAKVAPLAARDEPYARMTTNCPHKTLRSHYGDDCVALYERAFVLTGMLPVWEQVKGFDCIRRLTTTECYKRFPYLQGLGYSGVLQHVATLVDTSLTEWARTKNNG